jgi:hypothetical protein
VGKPRQVPVRGARRNAKFVHNHALSMVFP